MGGTKQKTQQQNTQQAQTTNTYQHIAPPVTPEVEEAKSVAKNLRGTVNPVIRSRYANERDGLNNTFINPADGNTTAGMREAAKTAAKNDIRTRELNETVGAQMGANVRDFSNQLGIAGMTMPQLVQTGGTSSGTSSGTSTTQQGGGLLNAIIGGAAQVGSAAMMSPNLWNKPKASVVPGNPAAAGLATTAGSPIGSAALL